MMKALNNSCKITSDKEVIKSCDKEVRYFFINNNKPEDVYDSDTIIIDEDDDNNDIVDEDEYDDEIFIQECESINDEVEVFEDEDDDIESKDDIYSDEDEDKEESKAIEDNNEFIPDVIILQDQIININHYLDNFNEVSTPFSSNKIKYLSKKRKQNNSLNVAKFVGILGKNNEGFIDFTKWKHDNICKVLHSNYSKSNAAQRKQ